MTDGNRGRKLFDGKPLSTVLQKLEYVFAMGGTDEEACIYADISSSALYDYQRANPEFLERKRLFKAKPILKARQTLMRGIETDPKIAIWFLTKKLPIEFGSSPVQDTRPYAPSEKARALIKRVFEGTNIQH